VTGWPSVLWRRRVHPLRRALRTTPVAHSRTISSDDATRLQPSIVHLAPKRTVCGVDQVPKVQLLTKVMPCRTTDWFDSLV